MTEPRDAQRLLGEAYSKLVKERDGLVEQLAGVRAERDALKADAMRLDFLDAMNARKNAQNGTRYGWRLSENHNRIALEDHNFPPKTVREAIDAALASTGKEG